MNMDTTNIPREEKKDQKKYLSLNARAQDRMRDFIYVVYVCLTKQASRDAHRCVCT